MYILEQSSLKQADIILTSEFSVISKGVRLTTLGKYSHAILYAGSGSYIHSDSNGVHSGNIQRLLFKKESNVIVLRSPLLTSDEKEKICNFARNEVGKEYSVKEAVKTKNPLNNTVNLTKQFCSRLVAQSYAFVNKDLVNNPNYCSPKDIYKSNNLNNVKNYVRQASSEEIEFSKTFDVNKRQEIITNELLKKIRNISNSNIQTIEEVVTYLVKNKEFDLKFSDIIKQSGYLTMYQYELDTNPWRYDKNEFLKLPYSRNELINIAYNHQNFFSENKKRYTNMFKHYYKLNLQYNLKYCQININLYMKLLNDISQLETTMKDVIQHLSSNS